MSFDDSEEREEGKARQCFLSVHSRRFAPIWINPLSNSVPVWIW